MTRSLEVETEEEEGDLRDAQLRWDGERRRGGKEERRKEKYDEIAKPKQSQTE